MSTQWGMGLRVVWTMGREDNYSFKLIFKKNLWAPISFLELFPEIGELKNATRTDCHVRFLALHMVSLEIFANKKTLGRVFILYFFF